MICPRLLSPATGGGNTVFSTAGAGAASRAKGRENFRPRHRVAAHAVKETNSPSAVRWNDASSPWMFFEDRRVFLPGVLEPQRSTPRRGESPPYSHRNTTHLKGRVGRIVVVPGPCVCSRRLRINFGGASVLPNFHRGSSSPDGLPPQDEGRNSVPGLSASNNCVLHPLLRRPRFSGWC